MLCLAKWDEHYPRNFMHLKPFAHNSAGGDTHSHIHQLITRSWSKPHTRGPWSPWSPCRRQEKGICLEIQGSNTYTHTNTSTVLITIWDWNHRGITQNTLIKKNTAGTLNYSLWLRVKSLMITWTDMNWVWEKDKEEWCEVWWVWWGGGCQVRFYAPDIFGFLPFLGWDRSQWTEHIPEGENKSTCVQKSVGLSH